LWLILAICLKVIKKEEGNVRAIIFVFTVGSLLLSGIIPGTFCTITKPFGLESNSYLKALEFDTVAWAKPKDRGEDDQGEDNDDQGEDNDDQGKVSVPEPEMMLMLGGVLLGLVAVSRKRFKTRS
jgi:hypothetical protein